MTFTVPLLLQGKTATGLEVPASYVEDLKGGKRPAVVVSLNGAHSYRSTIMPYAGQTMLPVAAEHREAAGLKAGDLVTVTLTLDTQPRTVELPEDLALALKNVAGGRESFETLAPSYQKAHVESVVTAKTPETRARRILKVVEAVTRSRPAYPTDGGPDGS